MSDLEKLERKVQGIRVVNSALMNEIEQLGGGADISIARTEHFIKWVCDKLEIDVMDRWDEQLQWEKALKPQLISMRDQIKEVRRQQEAEMERRRQQMQADMQAQVDAGKDPQEAKKPAIWTPGKN